MTIQEELKHWAQKKLTQYTRDALVDIAHARYVINEEAKLALPVKSSVKKLIKESAEYKKNSGVEALCFVSELLVWTWNEEEIKTPIELFSVDWKKTKLGKEVELNYDEQDSFLNPFLLKIFQLKNSSSREDLLDAIRNEKLDFSIEKTHLYTNLHPYRFNILRELEELSKKKPSPSAFTELLGFDKSEQTDFSLTEGSLVAFDVDQEEVFESIGAHDIVLQGPPGTGKSQTISNLLGKTLFQNKTALLSSEKSVALEVIYQAFKQHQLHHFLCFYKGKPFKKDFIKQIHEAWIFLENLQKSNTSYLEISELELSGLENKLRRINHSEAIGGMTLSKFKNLTHQKNLDSATVNNKLPNFSSFQNLKEQLRFFLEDDIFGKNKLWALLPFSTWSSSKNLELVQRDLDRLKVLINELYTTEVSFGELHKDIKRNDLVYLFYYDEKPLNQELLIKESKTQKLFFRLYNQYCKLEEEKELLSNEKQNWKKHLTTTEIDAFLSILESEKGIRFSHFRVKNKLKKLSNLHYSAIPSGLQNLKKLDELEHKLIELKAKLRKLNLPEELHHLKSVKNTLDRSLSADQNAIKELASLSLSERNTIYKNLIKLSEIKAVYEQYFSDFQFDVSVKNTLTHIIETLPFCSGVIDKIQQLTKAGLYAYTTEKSLATIELNIIKTDLTKFHHLNPDLSQFSGRKLKATLDRLTQLQKNENRHFIEVLKDIRKTEFDRLHELLLTPAYKLSEENKKFKKELRIGKKILINEFGKSRSYKSMLELMNSEASHWIKCIQPLFLLNTFQVADTLPLTQNLFDICILDEASQIPFTHALGSVFRAKRCLIAGDSQQMPPANYFAKDIEEKDILHHASFHFKQLYLKHHYRSKHAEIIAFSNRYFYNETLQVFPSPQYKNSVISVQTLAGVLREKGNKLEALELADFLKKCVEQNERNIGVVCFNEKQLKLLHKHLDQSVIDYFEIDNNNCFFKTLEKVQGDECNHLIISTTYAPNEMGEFAMRFGPLNQEGGEKRLNVLMSRAKEKISVFRSFTSSDLKISTNNGVETLRKLMLYLESKNEQNTLSFPDHIELSATDSLVIHLNKANEISARELLTQHQVYTLRDWQISYTM